MKTYPIKRGQWYSHFKDERTEGVFLIEEEEGYKTTATLELEEKTWFIRDWGVEDDCWVCESCFSVPASTVEKLFNLKKKITKKQSQNLSHSPMNSQ